MYGSFVKVFPRQTFALYGILNVNAMKMTEVELDQRIHHGTVGIKTDDSESWGQEKTAIIRETKITRPLSELFTRKTTKKIANALAKLP